MIQVETFDWNLLEFILVDIVADSSSGHSQCEAPVVRNVVIRSTGGMLSSIAIHKFIIGH